MAGSDKWVLQSTESRGEADIGHQLAGELQERSVSMAGPPLNILSGSL